MSKLLVVAEAYARDSADRHELGELQQWLELRGRWWWWRQQLRWWVGWRWRSGWAVLVAPDTHRARREADQAVDQRKKRVGEQF